MNKKNVAKKDLRRLLPLLETSYPGVCLADEEEYFEEARPEDWVMYEKDGVAAGYVRHFPDRENGFSQVDFYFDACITEPEAAAALRGYCADVVPAENIRLHLPMKKAAFIKACAAVLPVKSRFLYYEKRLLGPAVPVKRTRPAVPADAGRVADIMRSMGRYTPSGVSRWIKEGLCHCHMNGGAVIGACYMHRFPGEVEIEMIAILPGQRGNGHGRVFLEEMFSLLQMEGYGKIFLKVAEANKAAVSLYCATGMELNVDKSEVWLSRS